MPTDFSETIFVHTLDNQSVVETVQLLPPTLSTDAVSPQTNLGQL